ncbi:hypothetical protein [Comamonas sp. E6]|uniref:hypothetical protein n=1 Tax=Comamonas sp. E6 TaxID=364029 RepID=UPI0006360FFC|nr:hypothetical protein [Comamonas sp. E6]GAO73642.1 putative tRNA-dihydrouridine synthase [Comamonas sp. E6]
MATRIQEVSDAAIEAAQAEAMKIMTEAKLQIEKLGLEVSLITRCPNGSKWPVLMLDAGQSYPAIEAVRNGQR